jgi:hypothetical protein
MNRSLLVAMIVLTVLYGCTQTSNPVERVKKQHGLDKQVREQQTTEIAPEPPTSEPLAPEKPNLPEYNIMMDQDCSENFPQKCINAATDATSEEAFTLLTEHFRDENPGYRAILVTFYENHQMPETTADDGGAGKTSTRPRCRRCSRWRGSGWP